jgi:hypothetical protein
MRDSDYEPAADLEARMRAGSADPPTLVEVEMNAGF